MSSTGEWASKVAAKRQTLEKEKGELTAVTFLDDFVNILVHAEICGQSVNVTEGLKQAEQLQLYTRYKHGKGEVIAASRPGFMNMMARGKWDGWNAYINPTGGSNLPTPHDAQKEYVEIMTALLKSKNYNFETGEVTAA